MYIFLKRGVVSLFVISTNAFALEEIRQAPCIDLDKAVSVHLKDPKPGTIPRFLKRLLNGESFSPFTSLNNAQQLAEYLGISHYLPSFKALSKDLQLQYLNETMAEVFDEGEQQRLKMEYPKIFAYMENLVATGI